MTKRRKHNRTNKNGTTFVVREHELNLGLSGREFRLTWRRGQAHINGSVTYQTTCPQCRSAVFFYRNEHGSRVFFDALGAPWPKHGCTHGVKKMQYAPITSAQPVVKGKHQPPADRNALETDLVVDIENLKSGVQKYNREILRTVKATMKAKKK